MTELIASMAFVIITWTFLYFIFFGVGCFTSSLFKLSFSSFWTGWAVSIFLLQVWHLFFPVNKAAFLAITIIGILGLIYGRKKVFTLFKSIYQNRQTSAVFFIFVLWFANKALLPASNGDSGLYHAASVRWTNSYPAVPGLGNLHGRLAFNSSYFLYVALLESVKIGQWRNLSYHLANGLLLSVFFAQLLSSLTQVFKKTKKISLVSIFNIFFFYPAIQLALGYNFTSPSPDLPIFIIGLIIAGRLLSLLGEKKRRIYNLFSIIVLGVLGVTIKLSFLGFAVASFLITIPYTVKKDFRKVLFKAALVAVFALAVWSVRGVVLSGYPFYPTTFMPFFVKWRIPKASVYHMNDLIRGWARLPGLHWQTSLDNWQWLGPWSKRITKTPSITFPASLAFLSLLALLFFKIFGRFKPKKEIFPFFSLPVFCFVFWFFKAPDPRFAGSFFWVAASAGIVFFFAGLKYKHKIKILKAFISFYLVLSLAEVILVGEKRFIFDLFQKKRVLFALKNLKLNSTLLVKRAGENYGFYKAPYFGAEKFTTSSGLVLFVPKEKNQCWDAPLPCTPYPNAKLKLRGKNNLRYGFIIEPRDENDPAIGI